jgi:hypothetical protein
MSSVLTIFGEKETVDGWEACLLDKTKYVYDHKIQKFFGRCYTGEVNLTLPFVNMGLPKLSTEQKAYIQNKYGANTAIWRDMHEDLFQYDISVDMALNGTHGLYFIAHTNIIDIYTHKFNDEDYNLLVDSGFFDIVDEFKANGATRIITWI